MEGKCLCSALFFMLFLTASSFIFGANADEPTYCGPEDSYHVKVDNVVINPDPVVSGKPATFEISATSEDAISGGRLSIEVFFYGIHVHTESHDLCSKTACPVKQGSFIITNSQSLPGFTPPVMQVCTIPSDAPASNIVIFEDLSINSISQVGKQLLSMFHCISKA